MSILSKAYFHDEAEAFKHLEGILWPDGPTCPHCGSVERIYKIKPNPKKKVRLGLHKCGECRKQFTVTVGTVFERSHVPLNKWLQAVYLMCCSKKGISAKQLERTLEVTYKTAWFMAHRIREAMRSGDLSPMGGNGGTVEVDETFIGRDPNKKKRRGYAHKLAVLTLVDRDGKTRSFHIDKTDMKTVVPILRENIAKEARVMTDEAGQYKHLHRDFAGHDFVSHGRGEYVKADDPFIHTNTIEGYFSIFKRGMKGVYQHCGKQHLHRYLAEFDFRYNEREARGVNDMERTSSALRGIVGKRLTYGGPETRSEGVGA